MINVYPASVLYRWCKVVYNHQKQYYNYGNNFKIYHNIKIRLYLI